MCLCGRDDLTSLSAGRFSSPRHQPGALRHVPAVVGERLPCVSDSAAAVVVIHGPLLVFSTKAVLELKRRRCTEKELAEHSARAKSLLLSLPVSPLFRNLRSLCCCCSS